MGSNIRARHADKISNYRQLAEQIKEVWAQDLVRIVPVIIGATGEVPRSLRESFMSLGLRTNLYLPLQNSVLLDTCGIVRRYITGNPELLANGRV